MLKSQIQAQRHRAERTFPAASAGTDGSGHWDSSTSLSFKHRLSPSQGAGQQGLGQWGAWLGRTGFNLMGSYCVQGLSQAPEGTRGPSYTVLPLGLMTNGGGQTGCRYQAVRLGGHSGASARHVPTTVFHPTPYTNLCVCILPTLPGAGEMPCPLGASESQLSEILRLGYVPEAGSIWIWGRS